MWRRIANCWPDARFILLLRHPAAAVASLHASWHPFWHPGTSGTLGEAVKNGLRHMTKVEEARRALAAVTVRYEDLTVNSEEVIRGVCDFLTLPFESAMLSYRRRGHERFAPGLGDASDKIRSGRIQVPAPPPRASGIPAALKDICATWCYLDDPRASQPGLADAEADVAQ
jgi:Sulfotransferase family